MNPGSLKALESSCHTRPPPKLITKAAVDGLELVLREGFAFSKAEVLLLDLRQPGEFTATCSLRCSLNG